MPNYKVVRKDGRIAYFDEYVLALDYALWASYGSYEIHKFDSSENAYYQVD